MEGIGSRRKEGITEHRLWLTGFVFRRDGVGVLIIVRRGKNSEVARNARKLLKKPAYFEMAGSSLRFAERHPAVLFQVFSPSRSPVGCTKGIEPFHWLLEIPQS